MAVAYVSSSKSGVISNTSVSSAKPSGLNAGDVIIATVVGNNLTYLAISDNNGAYPFTKDYETTLGSSLHLEIWHRVVTGSEAASISFIMSADTAISCQLILAGYSGVDSSIYDIAPDAGYETYSTSVGSGLTIAVKEITTNYDGGYVCGYWTASSNVLTRYTSVSTLNIVQGNAWTSNRPALAYLDKVMASAGTYAASTVTYDATSTSGRARTVIYALKPLQAATGLGLSINISGTWKTISKAWVNISGTWKEVSKAWVNVAGTWKTK